MSLYGYYEIRKSNKLLNKAIDQKKILLQEVHHRVKNNLTLLNSLLYLRAKASDDTNVISVLNECQSRVQAMAIVHQNLYDVEDASKVDFSKFLKQLTNETKSLFCKNNTEIKTDIETNRLPKLGSKIENDQQLMKQLFQIPITDSQQVTELLKVSPSTANRLINE